VEGRKNTASSNRIRVHTFLFVQTHWKWV